METKELTYKQHPTKEDLLEYFGKRIAVRKMVPREAGRLMGLDDADIEKIEAYPFNTVQEKQEYLHRYNEELAALEKELDELKQQKTLRTALFNPKRFVEITKHIKFLKNEYKILKGDFISKTAQYRLYGNSIVVPCLYHIFRTLFLPNQPENKVAKANQLTLF